jgi:hypothetical protein
MNYNRYLFAVFLLFFLALSPLAVLADDSIKLEMLNIMRHSEPKIPSKAWLYIDKRFRNSNFLLKHSDIHKQNIEMGDGLSRGAEEALMEIFNEVAVINAERPLKEVFNETVIINMKADTSKKNMGVIVLPEIIEAFWVGSSISGPQFHLVCKWTIFDAKGKVLYVNTIDAMGKDNSSSPSTRVRKAMTQSAEDLYNKLILQMYSSKWWEYFR